MCICNCICVCNCICICFCICICIRIGRCIRLLLLYDSRHDIHNHYHRHRHAASQPLFQKTTRAVTETPSVQSMAVRLVLVHHMKHPPPILTCCHDADIHNRVPRFPEAFIRDLVSVIVSVPVSMEHPPQTSTWNHEELARTTYTQPDSSIPNTFHNTSRLPEQ